MQSLEGVSDAIFRCYFLHGTSTRALMDVCMSHFCVDIMLVNVDVQSYL